LTARPLFIENASFNRGRAGRFRRSISAVSR
jgi:hypothetical protein